MDSTYLPAAAGQEELELLGADKLGLLSWHGCLGEAEVLGWARVARPPPALDIIGQGPPGDRGLHSSQSRVKEGKWVRGQGSDEVGTCTLGSLG